MQSLSKLTAEAAAPPARLLSSILRELPDSAVSSIISSARQQGWTDILPLASGEPVFEFPKSAMQEILNAEANLVTKYSPFKGYEVLLEQIQQKLAAVNRIMATQEELIVVPGGSWGLYGTILALVNRDDEVLISDPCWEHYANIIRLTGAKPVKFRFAFQDGRYSPDLDSFRGAVTERTKAVLLNTPLNPCGAVLTEAEAGEMIDWCDRLGIWMVVDEEYESFIYDGHRHFSAGSVSPNVISLYSFSKSFALTGIRLGYVHGPREVINLMRRLGLYTYMFPASPSQCMAIGALTGNYQSYLDDVRTLYQQKMSRFYERIVAIPGIECWRPEGGIYLFPRLNVPEGRNPVEDLIREHHLLSVPGDVAGELGVGHIRLFFGLDDEILDKAADHLASYMNSF